MIQIDIDIPKTCDDCPFHIYHSGKDYVCVATPLFYPMNLANYKDGRKDFCPLKEVSQEPILDKIRAEINKNIEQEDFARSVFINKEKDYRKANQCTGNLQAYEKVLDVIDNLLKENGDV